MNTFITNANYSESIREEIKLLLESTNEPYTIEQYENGSSLMKRLESLDEPMDIVILSIHMEPDFDVIKAVDKLWRDWKQTYVIVLSVDNDLSTILKLQNKYHIWGYVLKQEVDLDFRQELNQLVYDAHLKVQHKNSYIDKLLRTRQQLVKDGST